MDFNQKHMEKVLEPTLMAYRLAGYEIKVMNFSTSLYFTVTSDSVPSNAILGEIFISGTNSGIMLKCVRFRGYDKGNRYRSIRKRYGAVPLAFANAIEYLEKI
jgi:hypothetical protein